MFYYDNKEHNLPHIHIAYTDFKAVVSSPSGNLLAGNFPPDKIKLVGAGLKFTKTNLLRTGNWQLKEMLYSKLRD